MRDPFIARLKKLLAWGLLFLLFSVFFTIIAVISTAIIGAIFQLPTDAYVWVGALVFISLWAFFISKFLRGNKKIEIPLPESRSETQKPAEPLEFRNPTETKTASPEKVWWNEVEESSQENRRIIQLIENMGYKFTQEKHGIDIYKVNDQGYVSDDIYFTITRQNEILKTERNASQIIGRFDSREDCLLKMYFMFKESHVRIDRKTIEEYFQNAKDLHDIGLLLRNMYGDEFVSNNIFFNQEMRERNGFYVYLFDNELSVKLKQGKFYLLTADVKFEEKHFVMKRLIELIAKKVEFDKLIVDLGIHIDDHKYLLLFSNYCFGFGMRIHEIEGANYIKDTIPDDRKSAAGQNTKSQHTVCSVCGAEFPVGDMHTIDGALLCQSCFSNRSGNNAPFDGEEDVPSIEEAMTSLREQIIAYIAKNPVFEYELTSLFWDDAAKCFPRGGGFNWDGAWFKLNLQTKKLSAEVGTYPNAVGAYYSDRIALSAAQFHDIAKQFKMRKELQAFASDDDWAKLFDDRLNTAVSAACTALQKRDEERKKEAVKMNAVKIPEQYAKQAPDMCLSEITIEIYQRYSSRSIHVSNDNGHYKIVYTLRSHTSPQIDSYPRLLSAAESVWLEKQVENTIDNPDSSTWESLVGADMMNVLIKREKGKNISLQRAKPIRKFSDLQNALENLAQYGSALCQSDNPATVKETQ